MAVRYVEIGQYPDVRREVRGKLSEILVSTANQGTYAAPEDVTGTFLEMGTDGKWDGASVGSFGSVGELNALPTAYLATGARASVLGVQYTYGAGGWVKAVGLDVYPPRESYGSVGGAAIDQIIGIGYAKRLIYQVARWVNSGRDKQDALGNLPVLSYMGDSIGTGQWPGQGPLEYLCAISQGYLVKGTNASIGGQTSTDMLARYDADIMAYPHDITIISCMTNDLIYSIDDATSYSNVLAMVDKEISAGKRPILAYIPPQTDYAAGVAKKNAILDKIAVLRNLGPVLDYWNPFATDNYSTWRTPDPTIGDGGHPSDETRWDAMRVTIGQLSSASLQPAFPTANSEPGSLVTNCLFQTDTNSDGVPDGWSVLGTPGGAFSITASPWGIGNALSIVTPSLTANATTLMRNISVTPGTRIRCVCKCKAENLSPDAFMQFMIQYTSGGTVYKYPMYLNISTTGDVVCNSDVLIPAGVTSAKASIGLSTRGTGYSAAGKVTFAQIAIYNMGAY